MPTLLTATRNSHKAAEIQAVLGQGFAFLTLTDFPEAPVLAETGVTLADNAALKARGLAAWWMSRPRESVPEVWAVLADDSGLEVDALQGAPGVHSARFAALEFGCEGNAPDGANNQKLLRLLSGIPEKRRTARFRCALALTRTDATISTVGFEGVCPGHIGFLQRGAAGFGYDPLFTPEGSKETFAELGSEVKNRISHRARALAALKAWLERA